MPDDEREVNSKSSCTNPVADTEYLNTESRSNSSGDCEPDDGSAASAPVPMDAAVSIPHLSDQIKTDKEDFDVDSLYLPPEHLASDDSDTAGMFNVNVDSDETSDQPYVRMHSPLQELESEDDSDDDEEDPLERYIRGREMDTTSSSDSEDSENSSHNEDDSILNTGKVRVKHNLLKSYMQRETGNFARKNHLNTYVDGMMGNLKFVQRLTCVATLEEHDGCVNALAFNDSGTLLASGSDDLQCVVWDMSTFSPYISFDTGHRANVFQTKFVPYSNDSQIVTCARDGQVRLAELSTTGSCRSTKRLATHKDSAHKLAVELDSPHCLLSAGEDGIVYQIDLRDTKPTKLLQCRTVERKKLPLHSIDKNPTRGHEFLVSGKDHFLRIYDKRMLPCESGAEPDGAVKKFCPLRFADSNPLHKDITSAVYNYCGTEILATYNDDDIYLFDSSHSDGADAVKNYTGHRNSATVKSVNFYGPKGEYVVSGSDCGNVFIWDKESTQVLQVQKGDVGGVVNVLEPHPYFPFLATSGLDNDIKLFMPTAEEPVDLTKYVKLMNRNVKQRETSRPDEINGQLLWLIMQQLRRARRRRQRRLEGRQDADDDDDDDDDDSSDGESSDDDGDGDDDDESGRSAGRGGNQMGCVTS